MPLWVDIASVAVAVMAVALAVWSMWQIQRVNGDRKMMGQINADLLRRAKLLEESNPGAVISFDGRGLIRSLNTSAERLFGYVESELFGRSILTILPQLASDLRTNGQTLEIRRKDGSRCFHSFRAERPERNEQTYLFFQDASVGNTLAAGPPLAAMERVVQRIVGEFEDPLTTISGYSELTLPAAAQDSSISDSLTEISAASERASQLTHALIAFTGKQVQPADALDLNALLLGLEPEIRATVAADVSIRTLPKPALLVVNADGLRQAILMLCAGAQRRMSRGDRLEIAVESRSVAVLKSVYSGELRVGAYYVLRIADTGRPLSAAAMAHLLEPLYLNREEIGVELSPIYGLIHRMLGRIDFSTAASGTVVELYLPQSATPQGP